MKSFDEIRRIKKFVLPEEEMIYNILIVGCGGTGGYVAANLSRLLANVPSSERPNLILCDHDNVEEKNLIRQHFIHSDIGKNKAEVLAERYSSAFGIPISIINKEIRDLNGLLSIGCSMIVGCVDNNATRKILHNSFNREDGDSLRYGFWIDSGNEESSGQVVCGFQKSQLDDDKTFNMPFVTEIFTNMLEGESKFNSEISCAENAESAPQNIMTNVTAATLVTNYVQMALLRIPISSHCVQIKKKNAFEVKYNTEDNLSIINR